LRPSSQSINTFAPPLLQGFVSSHLHPDNAREIYILHLPSINLTLTLSTVPTTNHQPTTNQPPPPLLLYQTTNQPTNPTLNHNGRPYLRRVCHGFPEPASLPRTASHTSPSSGPLQIDDASTLRRLDATFVPFDLQLARHTSTSISIHDYYAVIRPRLFNTRPRSHPWRCRRARLHWQAPCRVCCTLCSAPPTGHDLARPTG
jgi:hypothetical protein